MLMLVFSDRTARPKFDVPDASIGIEISTIAAKIFPFLIACIFSKIVTEFLPYNI
jgi:hypothetical protein